MGYLQGPQTHQLAVAREGESSQAFGEWEGGTSNRLLKESK
jgi:hypothetical protein